MAQTTLRIPHIHAQSPQCVGTQTLYSLRIQNPGFLNQVPTSSMNQNDDPGPIGMPARRCAGTM